MIKKIIFSLLTISSLFFVSDNVLAADMPNYLNSYYSINNTDYTFDCGDNLSSTCAMYTNLSQFFADFFTTYHYSIMIENNYSGSLSTYIYFFLDMPQLYYMDSYSSDGYAYYFQKDLNKIPYYYIYIDESLKKVNLRYRLGDDGTSGQILKDKYKYYTNFDLYDENGVLINSSSVFQYDYYYTLQPGKTMALMPLSCSQGSTSGFSYDSDNLTISSYNSSTDYWSTDIKLPKPTSSTLNYTFSTFNDNGCSSFYFYIYNYGTTSATIGFSSKELKIGTFGNLNDTGYDSDGNEIPNYSSDFVDRVNKENENIFDIILSIPNKIIFGFESFFNGIETALKALGQFIIDGLSSLFIPSDDFLNNWFEDLRISFEKQLGFLSYPVTWILDILDMFLTLSDTGSYLISWPAIKVPNFDQNIIESGSFDLATLLENTTLKNFHDIYLIIVDSLMLLAFFNLCMNTYNKIFGGSVDTYEYVTVDEGYSVNDDGTTTHSRVTSRRRL